MLMARNFIDGEFREARSRATLPTVEPATGEPWGLLADSDARDIDDAVNAATAAFPAWSRTPADERAGYLATIAELIERDLPAIAECESRDTGKPITLARTMDAPRAAANFRFFAGAIRHWRSESYRTETPAPAGAAPADPRGTEAPGAIARPAASLVSSGAVALNHVLRQPLGVVGLISPWNLPLYLLSWKIAPAIAAGNTCVCKPSELTPMTAQRLAELIVEAGLPRGVVNIVHGTGAKAGAALVAHPEVGAISFTGGTATGRAISAVAAPMFKKLSLELGGKNATVIFDDTDLDEMLPQIVRASFTNQGQVCLCGSRIFVERGLYARFLTRFVEAVRALKIGDPGDPGTQQGALISAAHLEKVRSYVELAKQEGGRIECGGKPPPLPVGGAPAGYAPAPSGAGARRCAGYFFEPTVATGLSPGCRVQQEEIFGPVATVTPFDTEAQAIEWSNCTPYGLSASVWTRDGSRAMRIAERLEAGTVWINCWLLRDLRVPFGGVKQSGVGREGGEEALRFFTEAKTVCVKY